MKEEDFQDLLSSVKEMSDIVSGAKTASRIREFDEPEVKSIREKMGLSQIQFASLIGVSKRTLENWEQGRRYPTGPARALLRLLEKNPEYTIKTLQGLN